MNITCEVCGKLEKKDHNYLIQDFFTRFFSNINYLGKELIPIKKLVYIIRKREIPKEYIEPFKDAKEYPPGLKPLFVLKYKKFYVIDGNHRVTGAIKAGYSGTMICKVYEVNHDDLENYINEYF